MTPDKKDPMQYGLRELEKDERDFQLGQYVDLPRLEDLPESFQLPILGIKDQKNSDFCAAYAAVLLSEMQEGVELSPEFAFAKAKELVGDYDGWGLQLREILKAMREKGTIKEVDAPFNVKTHDRDHLANWENWPKELDEKALVHKKKSYFSVSGPYDHFDNARAALWHYREQKQGIEFGILFGWPMNTMILDTQPQGGYGHAMAITGFTILENGEQVLIVKNSYGTQAGDRGTHYITRDIYNTFVERYGAFMMVDADPEDVRWRLENSIKEGDNWLVQIWKILKTFFLSFWSR